MTALTRRGILAGTAASLAPVVQVAAAQAKPTSHPDAELIAACAELVLLLDTYDATDFDALEGTAAAVQADSERSRISLAEYALSHRILVLRASTSDGVQARAHTLARMNGNFGDSFDGNSIVRDHLAALMRDAAAIGGLDTEAPAKPDADLLVACVAFDELEQAFIATDHRAEFDSPEEAAAEAERERIREAQEPLVERMAKLRATTREGMAARARSLALWDPRLLKEDDAEYVNERLARAIVRDLLADYAGA